MVRLEHRDATIELDSYTTSANLRELWQAVESIRSQVPLKTQHCRGCGVCCGDLIPVLGLDFDLFRNQLGFENLIMPPAPDLELRARAVRDMSRNMNIPEAESAVLYEFNQADPVTTVRHDDGTCVFLDNRICTVYESRFFVCRLYVCTMGTRLSTLQENIVTQGTWHAYSRLGWVPEEQIAHNPFAGAATYDDVDLGAFEALGPKSPQELFFFF